MRWNLVIVLMVVTLALAGNSFAVPRMAKYAVAKMTTPVLNTPNFAQVFGGKDGMSLQADKCGQLPALEFIALPRTVFKVEEVIRRGQQKILRVTTDEYPYPTPKGYYVDSRFVQLSAEKPPPRRRELPPRERIIERLLAAQGAPYVWGGNLKSGIPQMLLFYPPSLPLQDRELVHRWLMAGVDCSGLLYEATDGFTPRNTSALLTYGQPVRIAGLSVDEIIAKVQPLDLIVWKGHTIIILDQERAIESRPDCRGGADGVRLAALQDVIQEIAAKRMPVDEHCLIADQVKKSFVIRRWYGITADKDVTVPGASTPGGLPFFVPR